jgi:hypothetical protein
VRNKVSGLSSAAIRVETLSMEKSVIHTDIFVIDCTIEGEGDHHGKVAYLQLASFNSRSSGAVSRTKAVRQKTF